MATATPSTECGIQTTSKLSGESYLPYDVLWAIIRCLDSETLRAVSLLNATINDTGTPSWPLKWYLHFVDSAFSKSASVEIVHNRL